MIDVKQFAVSLVLVTMWASVAWTWQGPGGIEVQGQASLPLGNANIDAINPNINGGAILVPAPGSVAAAAAGVGAPIMPVGPMGPVAPIDPLAPIVPIVALTPEEELKIYEQFLRTPLGVAPFDPQVLSIPEIQLAFVRKMTRDDIVFYKDILHEAIDRRNKFAPSVSLMFKYGGKLVYNFIKNRLHERTINPRMEPKLEFFRMLADFAQTIIDRSAAIKKERGYTKSRVDIELFRQRVEAIFNYVQRVIEACPVGAYIKWNELPLYKDEPANPLYNADFIEEAADLLAQFRSIGYESTMFVAKRIVNLLRMFARGFIPTSENEV